AAQHVEAQEARHGAGYVDVIDEYILDEGPAPRPRLDVNSVGVGEGELAVLDAHVADAARGFAADTDAGEDAVGKGAVANVHVLCGMQQRVALHAAPRL
nr:hypothetical protein [Tanacetum cinerariifolium]